MGPVSRARESGAGPPERSTIPEDVLLLTRRDSGSEHRDREKTELRQSAEAVAERVHENVVVSDRFLQKLLG